MVWYNIKLIVRRIVKDKALSFINVVGLVIGIVSFLFLFLYIANEKSFDKHFTDHERIYRVASLPGGREETQWARSLGIIHTATATIPDIEKATQFSHCPMGTIKINDQSLQQKDIMSVDENFIEMFSVKATLGDLSEISNPNTVFITEDFAGKYFKNENPLGKTITVEALQYARNVGDYEIRGIIQNTHPKTHFKYELLLSQIGGLQERYKALPNNKTLWVYNYIKLKKGAMPGDVENKLLGFYDSSSLKQTQGPKEYQFQLIEMDDIHLKSNFRFELKESSSKINIGLFAVISIQHLICPLFGYNFNFFTGRILSNIIYLTLFCITVSFLASFLSAGNYFKKNTIVPSNQLFKNTYRNKKLFYVSAIQFCLTIGLIASVIVIYKQLNYAFTKDLGFTKENVIQITHPDIGQKKEALINEISKLSGVKNITASYGIPGLEATQNGYKPEGEDQWYMFGALHADENFINTYGIDLIQGRNFHKGELGKNQPYIINQTLANTLGWDNPIGKTIYRDGAHEVIGVVEDFHVGLIYSKIPPLIISMDMQDYFYSLSVAIQSDQMKQTLSAIEESWEAIMPEVPFNYFFFDEKFESLYKRIQRTGTTILIFAGIAILISVLGLFGISLLLINGKTKEIGIRKVNGAKIWEVLAMLNKDFLIWVVVAFIIATPIAYYSMHIWLQKFAYKTELSWWIFALAGFMALVIALMTVSWQSWRAARRNPVEALRYE